MSSRTLLNLLLVAVVAVLGAVAWFQPGMKQPPLPTTLSDLKPNDVARIRIERADAENVAFERRDGRWWMTEPVQTPASTTRMDGVLRILASKSKRQYPASQVDLTRVGLDQPEVMLFFNDGTPIAFGDVEPLTQSRYVRVGDTVHLIDDIGYYQVIGAYTTFVDSALLPEGAVVEGVSMPGLKVHRAQDQWVVEPKPAKFSVDQVNLLLDEWRHAQAADVRRYAGGKSQGEVVVTIKGRTEPLRLLIVGRDGELVFARPELNLEYHLPADAGQRLLTLPAFDAAAKTDAR